MGNVYGLRKGLPKVLSLEEKYGVRSTFFIRVDVVRSKEDRRAIGRIVDNGWEIGLHLINTVNDPEMPPPRSELERLQGLIDTPIHGVTPCGKTIGFRGDATWRTMDSLGLTYMEGYGAPGVDVDTFIMPTHLSFDIYYVGKFGEREGYRRFKGDLLHTLEEDELANVLVHPEWFVRSVGVRGLKRILLTLLRRQMMNKVYEKFLREFKVKVEFMRYIDLLKFLRPEIG